MEPDVKPESSPVAPLPGVERAGRSPAGQTLQALGDLVCCALLVGAYIAFVLALSPYLLQIPAHVGLLPR
jgi:hypothetical protein